MLDKNIPGKGCNDMCCIDVNKIFDSARDKDCLENLRVFLSADAQEALDRASSIRCRNVDIVSTSISLETVPFNKGYYQVNVRFYFCCTFDVCIYNGTVQEIRGVAACDKRILLFGGEKNISIFTSDPNNNSFCPQAPTDCEAQSTLPTAVVEGGCPHLSGYQSGGLQPSFRILLLRCGCVARFHPLLQRHSGRRRLRNEPALCDDRHIYRHQACTSRADHASFVQLLPARQGQHSCRLCERSVQRICLARIPDGRIYTFNRTSGAGKSSASARLRRQIKTAQSAPGRAARHAPADFLCINLP